MTKAKAVAKRPRGRPSLYSHAVAAEICRRIGEGETLQSVCRDERMPAVRTVNDWTEKRRDFSAAFARARVMGHDAIAASTLQIADDARNDWMEANHGEEAGWRANGENVQRSKLRIWTRLQLLAKWDPNRYGDRTTIAGDPKSPLGIAAVSMTPAEFRALALEIASKT
jgi:hypothetical protein